jgi:hypothetical protein
VVVIQDDNFNVDAKRVRRFCELKKAADNPIKWVSLGRAVDWVNCESVLPLMKETGTMICLTASLQIILKRVKGYTDRPLLNVADQRARIETLLQLRQPFYAQSDHIIDTSNLAVDEVDGVAGLPQRPDQLEERGAVDALALGQDDLELVGQDFLGAFLARGDVHRERGVSSASIRWEPSRMPVMIPLSAAGKVTLAAAFHSGEPKAREPSLKVCGTSLTISSVLRIIIGSIKIARATPPANAE